MEVTIDTPIHNERLKLLANALDRLSTACFTLGFLAPLAAVIYGPAAFNTDPRFFPLAAGSWIVGGVALHLFARIVLGGMRHDTP